MSTPPARGGNGNNTVGSWVTFPAAASSRRTDLGATTGPQLIRRHRPDTGRPNRRPENPPNIRCLGKLSLPIDAPRSGRPRVRVRTRIVLLPSPPTGSATDQHKIEIFLFPACPKWSPQCLSLALILSLTRLLSAAMIWRRNRRSSALPASIGNIGGERYFISRLCGNGRKDRPVSCRRKGLEWQAIFDQSVEKQIKRFQPGEAIAIILRDRQKPMI